MFKIFYRACIVALAMMACAFASAATTNQFKANDPYTGVTKIYTVDKVRMITATASSFVLQYNDGNSSEPFADSGYTKLNTLLLNAPALKNFKQIGTSGVYFNPDAVRAFYCQYGDGFVEASNTGDHIRLIWTPPGYLIAADPGCATFNAIKANSN